MSISLPNGTLLAAPSSSQAQVSAAVTRILHLSNFSPELKTRDIQVIFKDWENEKGGFRIKWLDDVNALVVFFDAGIAKRAYLHLLLYTPPTFPPPASIRPYDRPDAGQIIASLAARTMGHRSGISTASAMNGSISIPSADGSSHQRTGSSMALNGFTMPLKGTNSRATGRMGHSRTGSASSSWARGGGPGALNFTMPSTNAPRLPTHSEGTTPREGISRPSSTNNEGSDGVHVLENSYNRPAARISPGTTSNLSNPFDAYGQRRGSITADRAMRQVEMALASVEAQG
ncbi:hypothetical protein BD324DRAFT_595531 [Kockovaella imperatae]|uniref:Uncharacterized protein n=1 Tax=Kockovaella imperatae TaxID=4999 RepID=A0A1Y1U685_9TREE|nr:hypothetical protein BD324DRAFT_595531 [Kockovaella imperatae]ORX33550.1 hypothetical protein BD324DRAFT_595531 [Kockovaella imperatae]